MMAPHACWVKGRLPRCPPVLSHPPNKLLRLNSARESASSALQVHKGRYLGNNVAVKILPLNTDKNREAWSQVVLYPQFPLCRLCEARHALSLGGVQEAGMLNLLRVNRHDNIVESHSFSNNSLTKAFIVMEFMEVCATLYPFGSSAFCRLQSRSPRHDNAGWNSGPGSSP